MIEFIPISENEVKEKYPNHKVCESILCFSIKKKYQDVGFYVMERINENVGNASIEIFENFRFKVLSRDFLKYLFSHLLTFGFKEIYACTLLNGWESLFERFNANIVEAPTWGRKDRIWFKYICDNKETL